MKIVVGGTGLIGSKVVEKLKLKGHEEIAAAPNTGVNTITGEGLAQALANAAVVVDLANSPSFEDQAAMDFFQTAGQNLTAAEVGAGVRHHVALSVVGTDRLQDSGFPRQARPGAPDQEFAHPVHADPCHPVLRVRARDRSALDGRRHCAPAAGAVPADRGGGRRECNCGGGACRAGTIEIAGPDTFTLPEAIRQVLAQDGDPRKVIVDPAAPYYGTKVSERTLVPGVSARLGATKLDWWLTHVPPPPKK
jgi:uncharacterized protein YbjT (DUF2867 family)